MANFVSILAFGLISGYAWVAMTVALDYAGVFPFTALRAGGAALLVFLLLALARKPLRPPCGLVRIALIALVQTTGVMALISLSLSTGNAGKSAILTFTMPFWVLALAWPLLGEKLTRTKIIAGLLGLAGVILTFAPWTDPPDLLPMLFATASGLCWACGSLLIKPLGFTQTWDVVRLTAWQVALGTLPLIVLAILVPGGGIRPNGIFIANALFVIVAGTALAWLLWFFLLSRLSAGQAGLASLLVPVLGIIAAWIQLHERPDLWESIGMAGIILALITLAASNLLAERRRISAASA